MNQSCFARSAMVVAGLAACAADASVVLTFGFTDLDTSFDSGSSVLSAGAVDTGNLKTAGDVSRLIGLGGTAHYDAGFVSLGSMADFDLNMSISNILVDTADGAGTLSITDANGDLITGDIAGEWELLGGLFYVFEGLLSNVTVNDLSGDGSFDGPSSGAFSTSFPGQQPFSGAAVYLYFGAPGGFFSQDFAGVSGQIAGEIIPGPGSAALLGLAALGVARRRRR